MGAEELEETPGSSESSAALAPLFLSMNPLRPAEGLEGVRRRKPGFPGSRRSREDGFGLLDCGEEGR